MDASRLANKIILSIKNYFAENGYKKAVLGLSGGIDSAVVLALLVKALGKENVTALIMPNTKITKMENILDAKNLAEMFGVEYHVLPIDRKLESFEQTPWQQNKIAEANLNARIRAVILYNYANSNNALVVGTGNKSEFYMGYFTKYGDAAADIFPIADLYKSQVRALAEYFKLPAQFLKKTPTAELWLGQEDEKELGITYEELDELLPLILAKKPTPKNKKSTIEKILAQIKNTEHKRKPAFIIKL
jgi:NAD+ synthase